MRRDDTLGRGRGEHRLRAAVPDGGRPELALRVPDRHRRARLGGGRRRRVFAAGAVRARAVRRLGPGQSLTSYDAATGARLWTAPLPTPVTKTPALANGIVYVSADRRLYGFDAAGRTRCTGSPVACQPLWAVTTGAGTASAPAIANGAVHVASSDGSVSAYGLPRIGFGKSTLQGTSSTNPTATQFGPDGRLYVARLQRPDQGLHGDA